MNKPTPDDPLGLRADPASMGSVMAAFETMVDRRIEQAWRARTTQTLDGVPDTLLCMELIARGWVVYRPRVGETAT